MPTVTVAPAAVVLALWSPARLEIADLTDEELDTLLAAAVDLGADVAVELLLEG